MLSAASFYQYHTHPILQNCHKTAPGCLNAFYWRVIFAVDFVVAKTHNCLARMKASLLMQCITTEKQSNQINTL